MTNESISGFLTSIAEAKRAFDAEPDYQRRIATLEQDINRLQSTVAARELRIHDLKQNEETLTAKLRSVEAERDDAGFRAIQADDKVQNLLIAVRGFVNEGLKVISAVEGQEIMLVNKTDLEARSDELSKVRKENDNLAFEVALKEEELQRLKDEMAKAQEQLTRPFASATQSSQGEGTDPYFKPYEYPSDMPGQREADPSPVSVSDPIPQGLGQSEKDPTASNPATNTSQSETANVSGAGNMPSATTTAAPSEGQSEGPFAATDTTQSMSASSHSATTTDAAPSNASPPERNRDRSTFFKGRKYYDVVYFVPLHQWLNEGGTREDYYWRPAEANVPLPEASQASHRS